MAFVGLVYASSADRAAIRWRQVLWGIGLQVLIAVLILRVGFVRRGFLAFAAAVNWVMKFAYNGAELLFGNLVTGKIPVTAADGSQLGVAQVGAVVMLQILPTLIFVSALMSVLYHFRILQVVVKAMALAMERTMRVSGAEALSAAANVFMGMTEAPLLIRPYLAAMTTSELLAVMVGGFATISGSLMAVYALQFSVPFDQMLAASIISAPASLYLTKIALPEKGTPATLGRVEANTERDTVNFIDAAATGATTGLTLALNVGAMLLAFAAGLALIDAALGAVGGRLGVEGLSLGRVLGVLFWPVALLMGVNPGEAGPVGRLLGTKIALNEFFAYQELSGMALSARARSIATFALCGFANFGSIAIQLGGIGGLVPSRRRDLARMGFRAMLLGALSSIISATLAGLIQ